jgi:hypothetical protein
MYNAYAQMFSVEQFDSICHADSLSCDLKDWHVIYYRDAETDKPTSQYLWMKTVSPDIIYVVDNVREDSLFVVKRVSEIE